MLVSICIPTYNRADCLRQCLDSIIVARHSYENEVEILISNNASTDNTNHVINKYVNKFKNIKQYTHENLIRGEANFYYVASLSRGKYIWLFGDDDTVEPEAIKKVIQNIKSKPAALILNYSSWSHDFRNVHRVGYHQINQDKSYTDPNDVMKQFGLTIGLISSIVLRRRVFFAIKKNIYYKHICTGFPFVLLFYIGILHNTDIKYISKPIIRNRLNLARIDKFEVSIDERWYNTFSEGSYRIFKQLGKVGYNKYSIYCANNITLYRYIFFDVIDRKLKYKETYFIINKTLRYYFKYWIYWLLILPAVLSPHFLIHCIRKCKRYLVDNE
jgi:abequosyltransferase